MKKTIIFLMLLLVLIGCTNNNNPSSSFSSIDNKYTSLNFKGFGFNYDIYCEDGAILEESNMKFYEIQNYIIFDNSSSLKSFFTTSYILMDMNAISNYDDNYFVSSKALVIYYVGSPSYVDTIFEEIEYNNDHLIFYYHSVKDEGLLTNSVIKFNFMIIDLPHSAGNIMTFDFVDLTEK